MKDFGVNMGMDVTKVLHENLSRIQKYRWKIKLKKLKNEKGIKWHNISHIHGQTIHKRNRS